MVVTFQRATACGRAAPKVQRGNIRSAAVLTNESAGATRGPDLDEAVIDWLDSSLKVPEIAQFQSTSLLRSSPDSYEVVVMAGSWLWTYARSATPVRAIYRASRDALSFRRLGLSVWCVLPDTYVLPDSLFSNLFLWMCGGQSIVLQSSKSESDRWGNLNYSGPHFWTWTSSKRAQFSGKLGFESKNETVLIALTGDSKRRTFMELARQGLENDGFAIVASDYSMEWEEYVRAVTSSRVIVTANWTQEWYRTGSRSLVRKVASTTTTGRVWEAFAASALLVTNQTAVLRELGFIAGEHFLALPDKPQHLGRVLRSSLSKHRQMAEKGHHRFLHVVESSEGVLS